MSLVQRVIHFFAVPKDAALVRAQAQAYTRQVPVMYCILLVNTLVLAATHGSAPDLLRLYIPGLLTVASLARLLLWWRNRHHVITESQARGMLGGSVAVAGMLGVGFSLWALSLYAYGDAYQQSHVAFYMSVTSIGCVFCLQHLRGAAALVVVTVTIPFTVFFFLSGNPVFGALAFNLVIVVCALMWILLGNYRDFSALIASRAEMAQRQSETQHLSDENDRLANLDALTGLPNRRRFDRELEMRLERAATDGTAIAVGRLDVDGFKSINDIFGHVSGDRVLIEMSRRILATERPDMFVARLGADNFALILCAPVDENALASLGKALCSAMRTTFDLPDADIHLTASAGFAASRPGDTPESLFDRADYATYAAKREKRGSSVVFTERHASDISRVRKMEHALRTADLGKEIYILFQPQFDVTANRTSGYEVLARWKSPTLGEVSPVDFIPMAERIGLVSNITRTVLAKALAALEQLPDPLRLSVNLSAADLGSVVAVQSIIRQVQRAGTPSRVDFEITETAVMHDMLQANDALEMLLALGSRIALDDFGTGHSSLTHVQNLPLDRIKIDRSFVMHVTEDPTSRAIIKTMVDLCRNLGISCVFEGIETEEQLDALVGLGGTVMQGYLFGRPMSLDKALALLAEEQAGHPQQAASATV